MAAALGIGSGTVKTHLRRLYDKTGASRQADLVKLVAGFGNPLLAAAGDAEPVDAASWSGRVGCRSSADCYGANS